MAIRTLGYIVIATTDLPECRQLLTGTLGFRASDTLDGAIQMAFEARR